MNIAITNLGMARMHWRPEQAAIDIHQQKRMAPKFGEDFVKTGALPEVPQRLRVMQRNHAVQHGRGVVPGCAILWIRTNESRDLACRVAREFRGNHIADHDVPVVAKPLPMLAMNPFVFLLPVLLLFARRRHTEVFYRPTGRPSTVSTESPRISSTSKSG